MTAFPDRERFELPALLQKLRDGLFLSSDETAAFVAQSLEGLASPAQIGAFLMALSLRGETTEEVVGAARALRDRALTLRAPVGAVDCCGTGGDHSGTFNISTTVALVAAACGVPVAKHGNRAASSKSGAADVLEALGVNLDASTEKLESALKTIGFCFLMAPRHHEAMKNVSLARKALGFRTLFNMIGPLANPAGVRRQLVGVASEVWIDKVAGALATLGTDYAWVVHGCDGLDEITLTGPTHLAVVEGREVSRRILLPEDFDLTPVRPDDLYGGDANENAQTLRSILGGEKGPRRDIVLANVAAVLAVSGSQEPLPDLVCRAGKAIDSGAALSLLEAYATVTMS
ncbi:MAG: anthranilate phosphoribosyltransferase [Rhodospirillales bacterium]|nr:anthranilate phosphoribosyltransferase [Rhodospirillales bacterium]